MNNCKECGAENTNGTNFCSRKCRISWKIRHDKIYKNYMKKHKDPLLDKSITGRGVFNCDGNIE